MAPKYMTGGMLVGIIAAIVVIASLVPFLFPTPSPEDNLVGHPLIQYKFGDFHQDQNTIPEGAMVIEEFSDFQCPYCEQAFDTVKQLKKKYGGKVYLVYKHFPLPIHAQAQKAAEASECARDQGLFWEYHDLLFENQQRLLREDLLDYAEQLELDMPMFTSCLDTGSKRVDVQNNLGEGIQRGVQGTPTFFVNGQMLVGAQPLRNIEAAMRK